MSNLKSYVLTFALVCFAFASAFAQTDDASGSSDAVKMEKSRGADPNIKVEERLNGDGQESNVVQPGEKGAQARGSYCYVKFDNWTNWYIWGYVNGYNEGYIAPYGSGYVTVNGGSTSLYAVARFDDGSRVTWGPVSKYCSSNDYSMSVYETYYNWRLD